MELTSYLQQSQSCGNANSPDYLPQECLLSAVKGQREVKLTAFDLVSSVTAVLGSLVSGKFLYTWAAAHSNLTPIIPYSKDSLSPSTYSSSFAVAFGRKT
ncbi:hypothetical protein RIF29_46982 [Crotalaria pallida]|uniref:Uncharacterized protein n=1 Tax=Crotalaria pallida TaxID=3830 RepID=A0AAN9HHN1_CROPI